MSYSDPSLLGTTLNTTLDFACLNLEKAHSKESFINYFSPLSKNLTLIEEYEFFDAPYPNCQIKKEGSTSYVYIFTFEDFDHETEKTTTYRLMYLDTIHGGFIVVNLKGSYITNRLAYLTNWTGRFNKLEEGIFKHKYAESHLKYSYYAEIDKYLAIITSDLKLYRHPWYSWNKILTHMAG